MTLASGEEAACDLRFVVFSPRIGFRGVDDEGRVASDATFDSTGSTETSFSVSPSARETLSLSVTVGLTGGGCVCPDAGPRLKKDKIDFCPEPSCGDGFDLPPFLPFGVFVEDIARNHFTALHRSLSLSSYSADLPVQSSSDLSACDVRDDFLIPRWERKQCEWRQVRSVSR